MTFPPDLAIHGRGVFQHGAHARWYLGAGERRRISGGREGVGHGDEVLVEDCVHRRDVFLVAGNRAVPSLAFGGAQRFEALRIGRGVHDGGAVAILCIASRAPEHVEKVMQVHPKRAVERE
jgi:hypothetical protein